MSPPPRSPLPIAPSSSQSYLRTPSAIYAQSFDIIRTEANLAHLPTALHPLVIRVIHAVGMVDIPRDIRWNGDAVAHARTALEHGAHILCDVEMVRQGIISARLPHRNRVLCTLNDSGVADYATAHATTRSAAAVERWMPYLNGAVVAIGNAPTTLFRLLEKITAEGVRPAAIFAFPVGFVGAVESKDALCATVRDIPWVTLLGRRGGSAMAAAAVNALYDVPSHLQEQKE